MDIVNLINVLKVKFPDDAIDIGVAIELLANSISNVKSTVDKHIGKLLSENKHNEVEEHFSISREISYVLTLLDTYADNINIDETIETDDDDDEPINKKTKKINYNKYRVDDKMPYNLYYDYSHTRPAAFAIDNKPIDVSSWQDLYIKTCDYLYKKDKERFLKLIKDNDMQGRSRTYFSDSVDVLFKPKPIGDSKVFLESNLSANSIRNTIVKLLDKYGIPKNTYQIFLRADYSPLHKD